MRSLRNHHYYAWPKRQNQADRKSESKEKNDNNVNRTKRRRFIKGQKAVPSEEARWATFSRHSNKTRRRSKNSKATPFMKTPKTPPPLPPFGSQEKESRERRKVAARKLRLSAAVGRGLSNWAVLSRWSVTDHTLPHKWLFSFSVGQISAPAYYTFKNVALLGTFLFSNSK